MYIYAYMNTNSIMQANTSENRIKIFLNNKNTQSYPHTDRRNKNLFKVNRIKVTPAAILRQIQIE